MKRGIGFRLTLALAVFSLTAPAAAGETATVEYGTPSAEASVGDVGLRLTLGPARPGKSGDRVDLVVSAGGKTVAMLKGPVIDGGARGTASIVELDPANDAPEVVLSSFTGGAHCCRRITVFDKGAGGRWRRIDLGDFDGDGGGFLEDIDGDGRFELVIPDNRFLDAFDCYACSYGPLRIRAVEEGRVRDVTLELRFRARHAAWYAAAVENAAGQSQSESPGFLVGELGMRSVLGEGAAAWRDFEAKVAKAGIAPVEVCPGGAERCSAKARRKLPFAEAVRAFMQRNGYAL